MRRPERCREQLQHVMQRAPPSMRGKVRFLVATADCLHHHAANSHFRGMARCLGHAASLSIFFAAAWMTASKRSLRP